MSNERTSTGSPELDFILRGGFLANSINIIMGAPGTGKTILAQQMAFANATPERPALYLSTLSEPLEKFIIHGQTSDFFDTGKVGVSIFFEDLGIMLKQHGTSALAGIITDMIAKHRPKMIIIDSFKALSDLRPTAEDRRSLAFDLASVLTSYSCTSFLVGEYAEEMMTRLPEFAIADGVIQLIKLHIGTREQRFLRIEKLRGSATISGLHAFSISHSGIEVYPRLLTPSSFPDYSAAVQRLKTGITGLDEMIEGGFWRGSSTLVAGPTGSGKTVIGLHFIREGVKEGEPGIFVGFQENPVQIARIMQNFGWNPDEILGGDRFEFMYRSPVEMQLDSVASELFQRIRQGRIKRVVIDALGDLRRSSLDDNRFADYIYSLTQWCAVENVTCLMMLELDRLFDFQQISNEQVSNMSDNVLLLQFTSDLDMLRIIRTVKTRGSAHDQREHMLEISSEGVVVTNARQINE